MRILKELLSYQIEDFLYDKSNDIGRILDDIKGCINKEEEFFLLIQKIKIWNFERISLWAAEDILNYIDDLLSQYKKRVSENEPKIMSILKFLIVLLSNTNNKDIFSSFDHLSDIIRDTNNIDLKILIVEIYLNFQNSKTCLIDNYFEFCECYTFCINLRPILVDFILKKYDKLDKIFLEYDRILLMILRENKVPELYEKLTVFLPTCGNTSSTIDSFIKEFSYLSQDSKKSLIYSTLYNFIILLNYFNSNIYEDMKKALEFILSMINLIIFAFQRKNKVQMISEYYIEKYLKDTLEILTSSYDTGLKTFFLKCTTGFVHYFDGYESILFQNGLFHSIVSDMTNSKFEENTLQILSHEESINQDFFTTILIFLNKTHSFKEIPMHFLNKVLEIPRNNVYPFRIDNVIFSLKKKRIIDEHTLNELVIPRLIYELKNYHLDSNQLSYLYNSKISPTEFERTNLIIKLFKILFSIFDRTTNSQNLRPYYESNLLETIIAILNEIEIDITKMRVYEHVINSCIDFIAKLCCNIPTKVSNLIENNAIPMIFNILKKSIPQKQNILNTIFGFLYGVHLHDEGKLLVKHHSKPIIENIFDCIFKEDYLNSNIYSIKNFFNDSFYSPYTMFLRMEDEVEILELFFYKILQKIKDFNQYLNKIVLEEKDIMNKILYDEKYCYRFSYIISVITQFLINITQEEREILTKENIINFEEIILNYFNIIVHPLILYGLGTNGPISTSIIKSVFANNPEKLLDHLMRIIQETLKVISIKSGTNIFTKAENISTYLTNLDTNSMVVDHVFNEHHVDKMIGKLVYIIEITIRKLFFFVSKLNLDKLIILMGTLMLYLVRRQSNVNMYLSPVNGCVLVINQKNHFKFLSEKLSINVVNYLISEGKKNQVLNPIIFNESTFNVKDLVFSPNFDQNMRVEIIESNKVFSNEIFDFNCKNLINSHMSILDLLISIGKNNRKKLKELITGGDLLLTNWNSLAFSLILVILNLNTQKDSEYLDQLDLNKTEDLLKMINVLIYYINILNNTNIIILDKNMSGYVLYQFYHYGGIKKFFEMIEMLLHLTEKISEKEMKIPILLLLLIKNMWNIIISFFIKLFKMNFETIHHFSVIINLFGYNNAVEFSSYLKLSILKLFYKKILINSKFSMNKIAKFSYPFYTLILTIIDSCINQFKYYQTKTFPEEKYIKDVINMGFTRINVLIAMQEGMSNREDIADFILANNDLESKLKEYLKRKNNEDLMKFASQFFDVNEMDSLMIDFQSKSKDMTKLNEKYLKMFSKMYKILIDEDLNSQKLQQIRKMNLIFRIKDILLMNNKVLVQFIREIIVIDRENQIEIESKNLQDQNFEISEKNIKTLLQSRMLINYIIVKDRSKSANIFESLDLEEIAKILNDFNIIDNNLRTIKFVLKVIEKKKDFSNTYKEIIYESLFMIYLSFHFASYYERKKQFEKKNEDNSSKIQDNQTEKQNFDLSKNKADYIELFKEMIELQTKLNENENNKKVFIDEQSLIIIFMSISENFDFNDSLKSFIDKNGVKFLLKLKKTMYYENISDSKFKFKIVLDEAFRMFLFKLFEDTKSYETLLESIIKYVFANYYDSVQNGIENKKNDNDKFEEEEESDNKEIKDEKLDKEKTNDDKINNIKKNTEKNDMSGNYKSAETATTHNLNLEINFNTFLKVMFPYIIKNKECFIKVLQRLTVIDQKITESIENIDQFKKKKKAKSKKEEKTLVIRLLPEFSNDVLSLYREIKGSNETLQNQEKNEKCRDRIQEKSKEKFFEQTGSKTKSQNYNNQTNEKTKKGVIENQIEKIFKQYSSTKVKLMNQLMKHIWDITSDLKEKIESKLDKLDITSLNNEYMFPIDTMLITFSNIIHTYPSVMSIILKYHCVLSEPKKPVSFITFLMKNVFYVMNFYNTCDKIDSKTSLSKENKENKYFGYEPNTQLSIFEAFRSHNIISHLILSLAFKRRNMNSNEIFLISKVRKKIMTELDKELSYLSTIKSLELKNLISFKIINYALYNFTLFHENSHIYTSTNCFELMKILLSKEFSIIKNLLEIMKLIDIKDNFAFHIHKLASICLSEMTKFLKINNSDEKELFKKPQKLNMNNIKYDSNSNSYIIESLPQRNANLMDEDMLSQEEADEDDEEEGMEQSDSLGDEEDSEENSNEDFYYSLSNSENEEDEEMDDIDEEEELFDNDDDEESERIDLINNMDNQNMEMNEEEKIDEEDEIPDDENSAEEDEYDDESEMEMENFHNQFENPGENDDENANQQLDYDHFYNVRDHTESEDISEDVNDEHDLERYYRPRNRDLFNVFDNYNNQTNINVYNFFNLRRENNYANQMFNIHNQDDDNDNYMDEVFFFNPNIDKSLKNENNAYFEENLIFPFMIFLLNDELGDFYRPELYISLIHKIKKNHLYYLNVMFQYKFLSPFDRKMRKNIVFAVNGKDKTSNIYLKDFQKLETEFSTYYNDDLLKPYMSKLDSYDNINNYILSAFNIKIEEKTPSPKLIDNPIEEFNKNNYIEEESKVDKSSSKRSNQGLVVNKLENEGETKVKFAEDKRESKPSAQNSEILDINMEKEEEKKDIIINEELPNIGESGNNNFENNEEEQKNEKFNLEIDPQFLEQLPEDLAQEILKQQRTILNTNTNRSSNQYYDIANIDQDILNELPEEIKNEIISSYNPIIVNNENTTNNIDHTTFFESLPRDIREEILINASPELLSNLPPDLMAEAQLLIERESNSRRLIFANHRRAPPDPLQIHIPGENIFSNKNIKDNYSFSPPKYTFEETFVNQKNLKDLCNYFISFFDDEFLENIITFNIKYTCEFTPKNKISTNHNWNLINNLIQNSALRYKILDILFVVWIVDSICLKDLIKLNPNLINQNNLLKNLNSIFLEGKLLEEFFYDDFDQFIKNFCSNYNKEMKKFFLLTVYNEKGEMIKYKNVLKRIENPQDMTGNKKIMKKYAITKNILFIKDLLKISFEKDENVLSNLIRILLNNSKSDIKKIFALKIFTNVIQASLKSDSNTLISKGKKIDKSLNLSKKTIEIIVDLFYNFETVLQINKDKKSNNPTQLLIETIKDHKCLKRLLEVILEQDKKLKKSVSFSLENFFKNKKIDISEYSRPLPENVLFKIIKLINKIYMMTFTDKPNEEEKNNEMIMEIDMENNEVNQNQVENNNLNNNIDNNLENNNNLIMEGGEINNNLSNSQNQTTRKQSKVRIKTNSLQEKNKSIIMNFIKNFNEELMDCWERLDLLLFEVSKFMKEDQKIIDPKLNRLIPYIEAFILLSNLQFLPEKPNQMQKFIMETTYKKSPKYSPDYKFKKYISESEFADFFYKFCDKNKKVINLILRRYPKMFPNEILIKISNFLDLENKKKYFRFEIKKLCLEKAAHSITLQIRRNYIFEDSFHQLKDRKAEEMRAKITVKIVGEEAIDVGGVKREWFTLLAKEMFNPNLGLFKLSANGVTFQPNPKSHDVHTEHLELFKFIGRIIAKAIFDGFLLDCHFTRSFYKLILNQPLNYHDIEDYDAEYYKNLKWLLEKDISDMEECFTFSYEEDKFGVLEVKDLVENGRNIAVKEDNKFEYVQKLCYARLYDEIKPQIEAFNSGFNEIIPQKLISIFDHRELELVISGLPTIDISDWKNNTIYEGYSSESQIIKWFWEIVESFDNNERAEFLQFVTGSSKVPLEGFSNLSGIGGINKFKIAKAYDKNFDRLPSAHTCTNQLDLLDYPSKEILNERLILSIKEGKTFGFI